MGTNRRSVTNSQLLVSPFFFLQDCICLLVCSCWSESLQTWAKLLGLVNRLCWAGPVFSWMGRLSELNYTLHRQRQPHSVWVVSPHHYPSLLNCHPLWVRWDPVESALENFTHWFSRVALGAKPLSEKRFRSLVKVVLVRKEKVKPGFYCWVSVCVSFPGDKTATWGQNLLDSGKTICQEKTKCFSFFLYLFAKNE